MKIDARRVTDDLFPSLRKVGRPKTSILTRAEQLRQNQKAYRAPKNQHNNIDNALSKCKGFSLIELVQVIGIVSIMSLSTLEIFEVLEPEAQAIADYQTQNQKNICAFRKFKACSED